MQHVLRCWERQSDGSEYKKTLRRPGLRPGPRWGSLQRSRKLHSWWGGAGCLRCRPFGPRLSYPHSKISPDAVVHSTVSYIDDWPFWSHKSGSSSLRSPQSLSPSQTQALGMHEREAPGAHAQRSSPQPSTEHIHKSKSSSRHRGQSIIQCHSTASGVIIIILPE